MNTIMKMLDNFTPDAKIVFIVPDNTYAPLLQTGDTVELVTDYSEDGVKLVSIRDAFYLARIHLKGLCIEVTDIIGGGTTTYTEEQAEDLPVAVLGSVTQITFR